MANDDFRVDNFRKMAKKKRRPLGDELLDVVADCLDLMKEKDISLSNLFSADVENKWYVVFLKWAIQGRCDEFVSFCQNTSHEKVTETLLGLMKIYEYRPTSGFMGMGNKYKRAWGWLHAELTQSINFRFFISKVEEAKRLANQRRIDPEPFEIEWREEALEELMLSNKKDDIQENSDEDDNSKHSILPKETLDSLWSLAQKKHEEDKYYFHDKVFYLCFIVNEDDFDIYERLGEALELLEKYVTEETWEKMYDESPKLSKKDEDIIKKIYMQYLIKDGGLDDSGVPQYELCWIEDDEGNRAVIMTSTTGWLHSTHIELLDIFSSKEEAMNRLRSWGTLVE